jgi:hypothetical protein
LLAAAGTAKWAAASGVAGASVGGGGGGGAVAVLARASARRRRRSARSLLGERGAPLTVVLSVETVLLEEMVSGGAS